MDVFNDNKDIWFYIFGSIVLVVVLIWGAANMLGFGIGDITSNEDNQNPQDEERLEDPNLVLDKPEFNIDTTQDYWARFVTNFGEFEVDLYEAAAPVNVNNFIYLTNNNYYDGLIVYRMVDDLLVQSGSRKVLNDDPLDDPIGNPGYTVVDEINWDSLDLSRQKRDSLREDGYRTNPDVQSRRMQKYSLVMANTDEPNTAGSQFFIIIGENSDPRLNYLQGRHTVIGEIVEGREVVDEFRSIEVDTTGEISRPLEDIIFNSITIFKR